MNFANNNDFDVAIIGAGVVGLACARAIAMSGASVIILEKEAQIGTHTSARNSEVIHAGIYYQKDSAKARLCVEGKAKLYDYARTMGVAHKQCGKYIVATIDDEVAQLESIKAKAAANNVTDLQFTDCPYDFITAKAALLSPSTGIIDSHGLMSAFLAEAEAHGAVLALDTHVQRITDAFTIHTNDGAINACSVVNAAGLWASDVAHKIDALDKNTIPQTTYARGHYMKPSVPMPPVNHLIYPVPVKGGLGTHVTMDMGGQIRFGPDVEFIDSVDYNFGAGREASFLQSIQRYWPSFPESSLVPDYTGIRPKVAGGDFIIDTSCAGLVNLYGIESPGLTACMAIADEVVKNIID